MAEESEIVEAPLSAGPPPLFDVTSFSKWVTDVFTEEHDDEVLDKLAAMDASDDMAKMRLLLNEEVAARRARLVGEPLLKSYTPPEEGAGSRDVMILAFAGENDHMGGLPEKGGVTPEGFLKMAKKAGVRWTIVARDPTHSWFHRGLTEGDSEGFNSLLNALQAEINLVQPREIVCIGASMGGYAAIRAGLYLKASAVIAYSPQVLLGTADRLAAMILPMPSLDPYLLKLHLAAELEGFKPVTLIQAVEQCPGWDSTIQVHMGELDAHCGREIEMLRVCATRRGPGVKGGTGVKVSVRVHQSNDPLGEMKASGELLTLLKGYGRSKPKAATARGGMSAPRSARWLSPAGRQEAAQQAGLAQTARGPVVKPSDGRGFDAQLDARALPGESETQFKALLAMWKRVEADDLPGYFFWQKPAFELIHRNLISIATIFFEYCKKGNAVGGAGKDAKDGYAMSQREWVGMCKDAKIPVPIGEINDAHRRCDRATKEEKEEAAKKKGGKAASDKQLNLGEFLEALLRLAVKLLSTSSSGRKALKAGNGGEGFKRLMEKYLLPLQGKDSMAEMRENMFENVEVDRVLREMTEPLNKQFIAIAKRKTKILDPKKKPKGDGKKAEPVEEPLLTVEDFVKDIDRAKMFVDLKEVVPDPIRGNPDVICELEFSRLDAERGFIESQDREQAMLAMLTGDEMLMAQSSTLDFDEYQRLIAFCGLMMFRNVERMPPEEKVEAFASCLTAMRPAGAGNPCTPAPILDYRDYVIRERLDEVVKYSLSKGLKRFNPDTELVTQEEKDIGAIMDWTDTWKKMDLSDVHGWPLWEKEVYLILGAAFDEIASIFAYYAKSGGVGTSASSAFQLQQAEVTNFALDCELTTKDFMMTRIHMLMEQSDQTDAVVQKRNRFKGDEATTDAQRKGGDNALELFEFLELIVRVCFQRANPKYGSVGNREAKFPMPDVLDKTLKENILPKAKRDVLREILEKLKTDEKCQQVFKDFEKLPLERGGGLRKMFEEKAYETRQGIQKFGVQTVSLDTLTIWMGPDFQGDGTKCKNVLKDIMVNPTPQVTGNMEKPRHSNLSNLDLKGAYGTASKKGNDNKADGPGGEGVDYDEFLWILGLCGHIKYEEVEEMELHMRVEGMIRNFLQEEDEHKVISKYCCPPLPLYDTSTATPLEGQTQAELDTFIMFWKRCDFKHVFGFPLWEKDVFDLFNGCFEQLRSIFDYYAKSGTAGSGGAGGLLTMQQTELQNLALDVGLNSEKFSMTRVINIFKRADQVDDTKKSSDADVRIQTGEDAKAGDKGLELHEFMECVVMIAFERANPKFGEVGFNNKAFQVDQTGDKVRQMKKGPEWITLPGCLETLLKDVLLKKAKTDTLAKLKKVILADPACQAVLKEHRAYFKEEFSERSVDGNEAGKSETWTLEIMMEDFKERGLLVDRIIHPTPSVAGTTPPDVHTNLSWLDAKGAFATAQEKDDTLAASKGKTTMDANMTMTFDEYYMCVALCGTIKYEEIEQMTLAQKVEGIFLNYRHSTDGEKAAGKHAKHVEHKHGRKDEHAWISECLYPPLPRYDYAASGADPEFIKVYSKMDLFHVLGFPTWEKEAFTLFANHFSELQSIFTNYAKSGAAGSGSASSAMTMQKTEVTNLALDCELCNAQFTDARLTTLYERADQVDDTLYRDETTGVQKGGVAKMGDHGLEIHEFFELLCMIALARANPKYGSVGNTKQVAGEESIIKDPMPGCLEKLLKNSILKKAKSDGLAKVLKRVMKEPDIRAIFNANKAPLKKAFEARSNAQYAGTKAPTMTLDNLLGAMNERKVAKDVIVDPKPAITGYFTPEVHSNLSQLDIRGAFVTAQGSGSNAGAMNQAGGTVVDFEEFLNILGLCGSIKYEEIKEMSLTQTTQAIVDNFLQRKDEKAVIGEALYPPLPRFDWQNSGADPDFLKEWEKMDLSHIFGFPLWEETVFNLLAKNHKEVESVFIYYAKSGTAGASSANAALTMQGTELGNMCLDIDILYDGDAKKDGFNMTRVWNIFRRADQVDDTQKENAADHRVVDGEAARGGDRGLEQHEFYEALVALGFYRFNPDFGEVGKLYEAELDAGQTLAILLDKHLLKNAKKDSLAGVRTEIVTDPEIQKLFKETYAKQLRKEWKGIANGQGPMKVEGKEVINMEMFCTDMGQQGKGDFDKGSRRLVREVTVSPTPAVKGMTMPKVHSNLSQLDIKGAFVTAQNEDTSDDGVDSRQTIDFEEWCICLGLCGQIKYEEVSEMTLRDRVEGIISNYLKGEGPGWGDEHDVITKAVVAPILRFDTAYAVPTGGQPRDEFEVALDTWNKMDLGHLHGFPVWEGEVFELLKANFGEVQAIFAQYAKGDADSGSAKGAMTMQQTELTEFAVDCCIETPEFPMTRVIATFERADAVDKNSKSGAKEGAGDGALELHEFCEALVILAFGTANPKYEEAADADKDAAVVEPLPACFQSLLEKKILTNAKRDELAKTKTYIEKDRVVLKKIRPRRDACRELFEKECAEDTSVPKGPVPKMGMDKFTQSLFDKKIISDLKVSPTPQVAGEAVPEFHVCLTMADAKQAFVAMGTGDVDGETLTFDDFMVALCLCATFKYAEVKVPTDDDPEAGMALEKMCEAICFNYTGEKDEAKAITDALYPPLVRFDPEGLADEGFVELWKSMHLSSLYGFPLWEEGVFMALLSAFGELQSIFAQYAKSGGEKGAATAMEQKELTDLALDCSLATDAFPMERVIEVFEAADAVKDEAMLKKGAKADGALELHEFIAAVVMLSFYRANPQYSAENAGADAVPEPLPKCLENMLKDNLLLNAKRDSLATVKAAIGTDGATKQIIARQRDNLKSKFEKLCKSETSVKDKKSGPQLGMDLFCQNLFELGVAKEANVQCKSPVKGQTIPEVKTNLTLIDVKGAFVTSQKVEKKGNNSTINFEEFLMTLAICGTIKYGSVEQMNLAQRVEGIIENFLGNKDELAVVQPIVAPPPPRFNPAAFSVPGKPPPPATFMNAWKQMSLSHLWGFPTFEQGVFQLLESNYAELNSIFSQYAKSGTAGSASMSALMTIQESEFMSLCLDCGVQTDEFNSARVGNIFTRADQVDDTLKATKVKTIGVDVNAEKKGSSVDKNDQSVGDHRIAEVEITVMKGEDAKPGDNGLTFPEFLEALCALALGRYNPKLGQVGHNDACDDPLPGCLEKLLTQQILTNAKRDKLALVKSSLETDAEILAMMPEIKRRLQKTTPDSKSFDDITKVGVRKVFGKQVMNMDMLQDELTARRMTKEITIKPTPKIQGMEYPERHSNLSWLDAKGAFTTCQNGYTGRDTAETTEGNETIDFDEFCICLGLLGHIKYEEIDEMTLADRLNGAVDNWLVERDEQAVISDAVVPPPPRYDFENLSKPLKDQDPKEHAMLIGTWKKMDLNHVMGFPVWEEEVFGVIQRAFPELVSIFTEYAKSGSAGSGSAKATMTMQSTELTNLALDCELATDNFKMARINTIFQRADQVDDTYVVDKADKRKVKGKSAEMGDHGLELHEFMECLIMICFQRQNPDFGSMDPVTKKMRNDPEHVEVGFPDCVSQVLEKNILAKGRRNALAKMKKIIEKDPEVARVKQARKKALEPEFEKVCARDATTTMGTKDDFGEGGVGSTLGMDVFCDEMSDRVVAEDVKVTPTPNVTGLFLPSVHSNLSWLDCKGAFVTCQSGADMETIDFEEFLDCLALCGTIKYENVKGIGGDGPDTPAKDAEMPLHVIVDGIYANFLGEKDCHCVVTEFQQPKLPRYDYKSSGMDSKWINVYGKMDLSHVFGFPLWEEGVFRILGESYNELKLIFQQYAKTGSAGSASAQQLFTMQKTELTNLALDCGLATDEFPMVRVSNIFERADQVDDTLVVSKSNKNVKTGKGAEAGDHGLELHEFMECLVAMAFARANPKHGQVGKNDGAKNDFVLLPGCLETLLKTNILVKAKRDEVPGWLGEIVSTRAVEKAMERPAPAEFIAAAPKTAPLAPDTTIGDLVKLGWRKAAGKGQQGAAMTNKNMSDVGLTMTVDDFCQALLDNGMMKDLTIPPQPPVVGMAVEKVHLNLSALDIKAAFVGAQDTDVASGGQGVFKQGENKKAADALTMGNANHQIGFEEFLNALALCGQIKYLEVKGATMEQKVAGAFDNFVGVCAEKAVISRILYPPGPRTQIAKTSGPLPGQSPEAHALFVQTWNEAMKGCLEIDVIGFPLWEEAVFKMLQPVYDELQAIFSNYAQSIAGGSLQKSTLLAVTMQDNELASFCRDSGLITEKFSIARVQSVYKDVANAFSATKGTGGTAESGQGGGTGNYTAGIHMPGFIILLLLMALNRANPKLGQVGETGESAVDVPLPGCLETMLQGNILKKAKRNKMSTLKSELLASDYKAMVSSARGVLQKEFEKACKKREKMPAVALFAKYMMSRGTLVAEFKDKGIIVQKAVKGKPKVTGDAAADVELSLSALDCESAFTLCQDGAHGDAANDTIEFDEFLLALCMCGAFKYSSESAGMALPDRVEAIIKEYTGKSSAEAALIAAAPKVERYDPSGSGADPKFIAEWKKMDLQYLQGFPVWEEGVFNVMAQGFDDLKLLFEYYAGDTPGMQQNELVDLALDNCLPTKKFTITQIMALFDQINKESGAGDSDLELFEFMQFLISLAMSMDNNLDIKNEGANAVGALVGKLRRSVKMEELQGMLPEAQGEAAQAALSAQQAVVDAQWTKCGGGSERAFMKHLEACKLIRAVIVTMPGGAEGHADLTWQDASAAFQLAGGGADLDGASFATAIAICGLVKYKDVPGFSSGQKVEGILLNMSGAKDEHAVIPGGI